MIVKSCEELKGDLIAESQLGSEAPFRNHSAADQAAIAATGS